MIGLDLFPTRFFEIQLDKVDAFNLLHEIVRKEDEIKIISLTRQNQSIDDYITDFTYDRDSENVKLDNIDKIFKVIKNNFEENNSNIDIVDYWTSVYFKNGHHSLHNHRMDILDRCNYSGIIYLSDLGSTDFYSTSLTSFHSKYQCVSKMGKVIIFPSDIPHVALPTYSEENKRYVVAFNCEIRNK